MTSMFDDPFDMYYAAICLFIINQRDHTINRRINNARFLSAIIGQTTT